MICTECGAEMRWMREPITEQFRGEWITVDDIERFACDACGNDMMTAKEATKLSFACAEEYARRRGVTLEELKKDIRAHRII